MPDQPLAILERRESPAKVVTSTVILLEIRIRRQN